MQEIFEYQEQDMKDAVFGHTAIVEGVRMQGGASLVSLVGDHNSDSPLSSLGVKETQWLV